MNINIYMFNDHLLFSNNINDAASQLKNIQLQQLEEEKYKKISIQLQEQVRVLENKLNNLKEEKLRINLAPVYMPHGSYDSTPGWNSSDKKRWKEWWENLTDEQRKQWQKEWDKSQPTFRVHMPYGGWLPNVQPVEVIAAPGQIPYPLSHPNP